MQELAEDLLDRSYFVSPEKDEQIANAVATVSSCIKFVLKWGTLPLICYAALQARTPSLVEARATYVPTIIDLLVYNDPTAANLMPV